MKISLDELHKLGPSTSDTSLLLVHGGPGMDSTYFRDSLSSLGESFQLFTYDQGSHTNTKSMLGLIEELRSIISLIPGRNIFILAHSFGAAVAIEALKEASFQSVKGLILVSPAVGSDWVRFFTEEDAAGNNEINKIEAELSLIKPNLNADEYYKKESLAYLEFFFPQDSKEIGKRVLSNIKYNGTLRANVDSGYSEFNHEAWLGTTSLPLCIIYGGRDRITPRRYQTQFNRFAFRNHAYEIAEAGHFPFVDDSQSFCLAVSRFIKELTKEGT